jgi:hypothetical protein
VPAPGLIWPLRQLPPTCFVLAGNTLFAINRAFIYLSIDSTRSSNRKLTPRRLTSLIGQYAHGGK